MIKDNKVISLVKKEDYQKFGGDFMGVYYKESLLGVDVGWTLDTSSGIMTSKSKNSYQNYTRVTLGYLHIGDIIEFSGEFASAGHPIVFMLEYSNDASMSGLTWEEGVTPLTNINDQLTMRNYQLNVKKSGYYRLIVGCYLNTPSEYMMRNLVVKLHSIQSYSISPVSTGTWTPSVSGVAGTFLGDYTVTGDRVTVRAHITLSSKGTNTGAVTIGGLPFTPKLDQVNFGYAELDRATITPADARLYANLALGYRTMYIRKAINGAQNEFLTYDELSDTTIIYTEITYIF